MRDLIGYVAAVLGAAVVGWWLLAKSRPQGKHRAPSDAPAPQEQAPQALGALPDPREARQGRWDKRWQEEHATTGRELAPLAPDWTGAHLEGRSRWFKPETYERPYVGDAYANPEDVRRFVTHPITEERQS